MLISKRFKSSGKLLKDRPFHEEVSKRKDDGLRVWFEKEQREKEKKREEEKIYIRSCLEKKTLKEDSHPCKTSGER